MAVVDAYGDSHAESDLAAWRSYYGLPPCTTANGCFQKVDQNGATSYPADNAGWGVETSLDLDAVSAACPNCHILLVEAGTASLKNLGTAENTAVALGAKFVSNSYGAPEALAGPRVMSFDRYYEHPGVAIDAATGDSGWASGFGSGGSWPATNPDVAGIGGTTLAQDSSVPRGWTETAWGKGGSGCSLYEEQPYYQASLTNLTAACPGNKAAADISADANPASGLAVYDTLGEPAPWEQVGGTSLASPLVTAMYALAGTPPAGTYPVTYPYLDPSQSTDLNDTTSGSNGPCGNVLCNAGPGWDGPTGLGTPNGVDALAAPPSGTVSGQVTNQATGGPVAGVAITAGHYSVTTDSSGDYTLTVPAGTYTVTAVDYGYTQGTASVQVTLGQTSTENFTLTALPAHTLSGTVTDASGHGYPLYARIAISGYPHNAVYTNPYTGHYSVKLAQGSYTFTVTPVYPGYTPATASVSVGTSSQVQNFQATVDSSCTAPGYGVSFDGISETFTNWPPKTPQDGWTVLDNAGSGDVWSFVTGGNGPVPPDSDGDFAVMDALNYGSASAMDTSLVSPVVNLTGVSAPTISFDSWFTATNSDSNGYVDLSLNGGQTWTTVWHRWSEEIETSDIAIPQAANQPDVQVRFRYTNPAGVGNLWWSIDNVQIGQPQCLPTSGGYVDGTVNDASTGKPINGVKITSQANPAQYGVSAANPGDPAQANGFYWLFAGPPGGTQFTQTPPAGYGSSSQTVTVAGNAVTQQNWSVPVGNLSVTPGSVSVSAAVGSAQTQQPVTVTNTGTLPIQVNLTGQDGGFTSMGAMTGSAHRARPGHPAAAGLAWTTLPHLPAGLAQNAVGYDSSTGNVYSIGGSAYTAGPQDLGFVYNPSSQGWAPVSNPPQALEGAAGAFLDGRMYTVGGSASATYPLNSVYAYDPANGVWSKEASLPARVMEAAGAVLDGKLYVVGGCTDYCYPLIHSTPVNTTSDAVYSYDPASNKWTTLAHYPENVALLACAGVGGKLVCAGGITKDPSSFFATVFNTTYIYDPDTGTWSQGASIPYDNWAMSYTGANGKLQIAGGITGQDDSSVTSQAEQYDPVVNTWSALPSIPQPVYLGGMTCGLYEVGGSVDIHDAQLDQTWDSEQLPGYGDCGQAPSWLSVSPGSFTLAPGQSQTVTVTLNPSAVSQPGTYTAALGVTTNSAHEFAPVAITMQATPPASWGKVTGTVTDAAGNPVHFATVQICAGYDTATGACSAGTYYVTTDQNGGYQMWLPQADDPLQMIASKNGYAPATALASITQGATTTQNFTLTSTA